MEPFDVIDLKTYASTEWLFDSKKSYKTVFERYFVNYLYAEFSFYNLQYKREDWVMDIVLHFVAVKGEKYENQELATLPLKRDVSKDDPVVQMREGWGIQQKGFFWGGGDYKCTVEVNGTVVKEKTFYVEDAWRPMGIQTNDETVYFEAGWHLDEVKLQKIIPVMTEPLTSNAKDNFTFLFGENPYFEVESVRLFESNYEQDTEVVYADTFEAENTRYIYTELCLKNKLTDRDWRGEFKLIYETEGGEIKGIVNRIITVKPEETISKIIFGWGSDVTGSWRVGEGKAKVVFQDKIVAATDFVVVG